MGLEDAFPGLVGTSYRITSLADRRYNCIAWAAGRTSYWLWLEVSEHAEWPPAIPLEETVTAFDLFFRWLGFVPCVSEQLELGFEKVALFAKSANEPKHAARQLPNGKWTSKLGKSKTLSTICTRSKAKSRDRRSRLPPAPDRHTTLNVSPSRLTS